VPRTIVDAVDFGMNAQEAVDAAAPPSWLPNVINYERFGFSPTPSGARTPRPHPARGGARARRQVIIYDAKEDMLAAAAIAAPQTASRRRARTHRRPARDGAAIAKALG